MWQLQLYVCMSISIPGLEPRFLGEGEKEPASNCIKLKHGNHMELNECHQHGQGCYNVKHTLVLLVTTALCVCTDNVLVQ